MRAFHGSILILAAMAAVLAPPPVRAAESNGIVEAYLAAWNGGSAGMEDLLAPEFVDRSMLLPLDATAFRMQVKRWREAIPDLQVTLLERTRAPGVEILRLRYAGRPSDPSLLTPLSGGRIAIEQTERLTLDGEHLTGRMATTDEWTLPAELMFAPPPAQPVAMLPAATVVTLGANRFPESLAFAPDGTLYLSTGPEGTILRLDASFRPTPFAQIAVGPGGYLMCLTIAPNGTMYTSAISMDPAVRGVWAVMPDGRATRLATLPDGATPNGIALDGRGHVLVADSFAGTIWRVPVEGGTAEPWMRHPWLAPRPLVGRFPGANGLQRAGDAVIVAVSDRSLLVRIPIRADGGPGLPEVVAAGLPGDDFAVTADGTLYVTTHPFNSIVRVGAGGDRTVVAGPEQGVIGPTAAAIGPDGALYVANDGGLWRPLPGVAPVATVTRHALGKAVPNPASSTGSANRAGSEPRDAPR